MSKWDILGQCEMRWIQYGEITTDKVHIVYSSGREDQHEQGVGFHVQKGIVNTVIGCRPITYAKSKPI